MYIITANGKSKIYHLAYKLDGFANAYSTVCEYYNYVLPGGKRVMLVDEVADDRRLCKRCQALTETK